MIPRATYRVQFHEGFTFADALPLAPYLARLGVSHLYASPIATARAGSTHGYDVVDPTTINPRLGGEEGFRALVQALHAHGIGVILDIVPNHVAVGGEENGWWLDVLENGPDSAFARWFDIDWTPDDPGLHGKVLAPFLGGPYAEVLAAGELRLDVEPQSGRLSLLAYGAHRFPLRRADYPQVLREVGADEVSAVTPQRLASRFDGRDLEGRARLHALLERQHWRLAWWRIAGDAINWRRFFDITELAGLRVEVPEVFDAVHALPLRLFAEGLIDGVRVDHVDGLADPAAYLRRLRGALDARTPGRPEDRKEPAWLVVEKILGAGEDLSPDWGADGTTGYEFMNEVSAVLHAPEAAAPLADLWSQVSGRSGDFEVEEDAAREEILRLSFAGQLDALAAALHRAGQSAVETRDIGRPGFRRAAAALVRAFRVYRTYGTGDAAPSRDNGPREAAVAAAMHDAPLDAAPIRLIADWLAGAGPGEAELRRDAVRRFQQLSAPIAAKAVEDTAFYRYGRLLSRNDVGFDPARLASRAEDFLETCRRRGALFPGAMLATATHDHKRGEDVRARLSVLSEAPQAWAAQLTGWVAKASSAGMHPADAATLLQTVVGAWPLDLSRDDAQGLEWFAERVAGWQTKALREGKLRSSWTVPDEGYEARCNAFSTAVLRDPAQAQTRAELCALVDLIAPAGAAKGLVQAGLRMTLPGVPDLYQGCEGWDFSLVDPDNRRPVDFALRRAWLDDEVTGWRDGAVKQRLVQELLQLRRAHPALFATGELRPLRLKGSRAGDALAFVRRHGDLELVVVAVLRTLAACPQAPELPPGWWADTQVVGLQTGPRPAESLAPGGRVFSATLLS